MADRDIVHVPQMILKVKYKGRTLESTYKADFVCFGDVIVELKAMAHEITGIERAQLMNYLKATGFRRGLLINFGWASLKYERIVVGEEAARDTDLELER